jgi:hypothetical protein
VNNGYDSFKEVYETTVAAIITLTRLFGKGIDDATIRLVLTCFDGVGEPLCG